MLLWSGQVVSNMGSQVSQLAFPLFILLLTHSPVQAGLAGALRATIGLIFAIGGIGGMVGAILAPPLQKRVSFGQAIIGTSWLFGLLTFLYIFAPNPLILGIITALLFTCGPTYNVVSVSYRLVLIPDELQGRVNSAFRLIAFCGQPLGLAVTGVLLQTINAIPTVLIMGIGLLALALMATLNRHVRKAPPLAETQHT
jgi:predicted MFS family arabinose efflux permease